MVLNFILRACFSSRFTTSWFLLNKSLGGTSHQVFQGRTNDEPLSDRLAQLLLQYMNMPHSTTGMIPAELLVGQKLRSRLDLIQPKLGGHVHNKQGQQQRHHDQHSKQHTFAMGERVYVKITEGGVSWLLAVISNDRPSVLQSGDGEWKTAIKTTFGGGLVKLGSPVGMKMTYSAKFQRLMQAFHLETQTDMILMLQISH